MLCPYVRTVLCVAMGYRQTVGGSLSCVGWGGCVRACHPAPPCPRPSCACSVQTTHEHIVKHQYRRPVHLFASPNRGKGATSRSVARSEKTVKAASARESGLSAERSSPRALQHVSLKYRNNQTREGGSPRRLDIVRRRSMRSCPLARRARPPGGLHHRMRSEFLLRLRLPTLARRRAASGLRLLTPPSPRASLAGRSPR